MVLGAPVGINYDNGTLSESWGQIKVQVTELANAHASVGDQIQVNVGFLKTIVGAINCL